MFKGKKKVFAFVKLYLLYLIYTSIFSFLIHNNIIKDKYNDFNFIYDIDREKKREENES